MSAIIQQKSIFLILLLFVSTLCTAQQVISGTVLDIENNPIEFVNISLVDTSSQRLITGMITDDKGQFRMETSAAAVLELRIQFIGYEKWAQILGAESKIDLGVIKLLENVNELAEAVVTAERPVIERKEDQLVFNIASSTLNNGYDGIEVLEQAPYIWIDEDDNIQIRNQSVTIQVNGRPLNINGADLASYIRNLRSKNIKSIEILTTPAATADASNLGGVINIVLKEKVVGFNSNIRTSYSNYGDGFYRFIPDVNFNYGAERWNLYGSYRLLRFDSEAKVRTDIFYNDTKDYLQTAFVSEAKTKRHNYQLGFVLDAWKNHELGIEVFGGNMDRLHEIAGRLAYTNLNDTIDSGVTETSNDVQRSINSAILNYTWRIDTMKSTLKIITDRTRQHSDDLNSAVSTYDLAWFDDNEIRNTFDNQTDIFSVQTDLVKYFKDSWKLESGLKGARTERDNQLLAEELLGDGFEEVNGSASLTYKEDISAAYLTFSKSFLKSHFVKVGLRTEHTNLDRIDLLNPDTISRNYTDWFPSVYYAFDLPKGGSLSATYSRRLNRPAFFELNNDIRKVNDFRYSIGNPDLRPEYIDLYELRFQKKKQSISAYYRKYNDAINGIFFLEDSIAYYQRQNNGAQVQFGLEHNITFKPMNWWSVRSSNHLYQRKYTDNAGNDSFKRATFSFRLFNTFTFNKTTSMDVVVRYQSKTEDAFYIQDAFYYTNLILKKSFFEKKFNCRIYLFDIFNIFESGNTRPFDDIITTRWQKSRTRFIRFWVSYNFSNKGQWKKRRNNTDNDVRRRL